jgi:hypothetical protein
VRAECDFPDAWDVGAAAECGGLHWGRGENGGTRGGGDRTERAVASAFLGPDASVTSLYVEEGRRGRGLAKAVMGELLRRGMVAFVGGGAKGDAGLAHADVAVGNVGSEGVCRSLGGSVDGKTAWVYVDMRVLGDGTAARWVVWAGRGEGGGCWGFGDMLRRWYTLPETLR